MTSRVVLFAAYAVTFLESRGKVRGRCKYIQEIFTTYLECRARTGCDTNIYVEAVYDQLRLFNFVAPQVNLKIAEIGLSHEQKEINLLKLFNEGGYSEIKTAYFLEQY